MDRNPEHSPTTACVLFREFCACPLVTFSSPPKA